MFACQDPITTAAWRTKPSTFIATRQDNVFPLEAQEALAARAGSTVRYMDTSHSPFLSQPIELADLIEEAAGA